MKIYTHGTKNDLTAWASTRLYGPIRFGGPVSTFVPPENFLSEALVVTPSPPDCATAYTVRASTAWKHNAQPTDEPLKLYT